MHVTGYAVDLPSLTDSCCMIPLSWLYLLLRCSAVAQALLQLLMDVRQRKAEKVRECTMQLLIIAAQVCWSCSARQPWPLYT